MHASQVLGRFKREVGDPAYADLKIEFSPDNPARELWIIKAGKNQIAEPEPDPNPSANLVSTIDIKL